MTLQEGEMSMTESTGSQTMLFSYFCVFCFLIKEKNIFIIFIHGFLNTLRSTSVTN